MLEKLPDSVGQALRDRRAGLDQTAYLRLPLGPGQGAITLTSLAFADHAPIPANYTADGAGTSPPLQWTGVPRTAESLILLVEDADSPTPHPLVHAIAVDLPAEDGALPEGAFVRGADAADAEMKLGRNSTLMTGWLPPDPPPGHGVHRYVFQLYALGPGAPLRGTPGRDAVLEALGERAIASGWLVGTYERDASVTVGSATAGAVGAT